MTRRLVAARSTKGLIVYQDEVCSAGTCLRPPGHAGKHDQFDSPKSPDSVPFHPEDPVSVDPWPLTEDHKRLYVVLHTLWGKAKDHSDYEKPQWKELNNLIDSLVREAIHFDSDGGCVQCGRSPYACDCKVVL